MTSVPFQILSAMLGQASAGQAAETAAAEITQIQSVWDFMIKGGPMMIPIGLCSLIAVTVIVERLFSLRRRNVIPPEFFPGLKTVMDAGEESHTHALAYCEKHNTPLAAIIATGVRRLSESVDLLEKHIQQAGQRAVFGMRKYLRTLSVIASICPLMGLLGTIFGMIKAFQTVASSGEALGRTELLAEGIYQAMITTAAGLLVAIPVMIAYHMIAAKIDRLVGEMDQMTVEFVEEYAIASDVRTEASLRLERINGSPALESAAVAQS